MLLNPLPTVNTRALRNKTCICMLSSMCVCHFHVRLCLYKRHIWGRSAVLWDVRCCCVCVCLSWSSEWHQLLKIAAAHFLLFSTPGPAQAITTHACRRSPNYSLLLTHHLLGWILNVSYSIPTYRVLNTKLDQIHNSCCCSEYLLTTTHSLIWYNLVM